MSERISVLLDGLPSAKQRREAMKMLRSHAIKVGRGVQAETLVWQDMSDLTKKTGWAILLRGRRRSPSEETLALQVKALGLPEPEREMAFAAPERRFRADFLWLSARLIVEVQGGTRSGRSRHSKGRGFENDCEKTFEALRRGYRVLPVTTAQVRSGVAVKWIEELVKFRP